MRRVSLLGLLVVTGCGSSPLGFGGERACTAIGALVGVSVEIAAQRSGAEAAAATLEACWDGACQSRSVALLPRTAPADTTCTGSGPDDVCSAQVRETEGKQGFAEIMDLPVKEVRVTLTVTDQAGTRLAHQTLDVTPEQVYPNGPGCEPGGPQASLTVDGAGTVHDGTR